jgi:hypothetical protein
MPAVCLAAGLAMGCATRWTPPDIPHQPADTTALGVRDDLPPLAMWPGEARRVALPVILTRPKSPRAFVLRGDPALSFRLDLPKTVFVPILQGALPAPNAQGACVVRVDSLATPGDTLSFHYTVSTTTQPPRFSRWRGSVVVEMPLLVIDGLGGAGNAVSVGPNPFNPETTVHYVVTTPGRVTLEVYDVRGARIATLVDASMMAGEHTATWNGRDEKGVPVGSGVYFGRLTSSAGVRSYKMTVVK